MLISVYPRSEEGVQASAYVVTKVHGDMTMERKELQTKLYPEDCRVILCAYICYICNICAIQR